MAQKDNITPEERLLKIIESPAQDIPKRKAPAVKREAGAFFNIDKLIAGFKGIRVNKDTLKNLKNIDLTVINKIAICACGLFTFFWLFVSIRDGFALRARFDRIKTGAATRAAGGDLLPDINIDINGLLASARSRNIFSLTPQKSQPTGSSGEPQASAAVTAAAIAADIKLVGIIWSDSPQAMLEDVKGQKTYLLSAGESVGNFKVKEIFQNKVIVESQGQEQELR